MYSFEKLLGIQEEQKMIYSNDCRVEVRRGGTARHNSLLDARVTGTTL
jgi:hypothetical protein